jgi:hypothetical protein
LAPHLRRHDRDTACGCGAGSGTCLIGASRSGPDAIRPQIESRGSGPIARLRAVRQAPCSVRIDLKADLTRLTATARLLPCTRSGRRPQRASDRPQHHSQAGLGQEQPQGGHGPAAPHSAFAGDDDWVMAIEGPPRRFAPPACRRSEEMTPMARYRGPLARARYAGQQRADRALRGAHAGRHRATGEDSPPAFPTATRPVMETPRGGSVRATLQNGLSQALASAPQRRRRHARPTFMGRASMTARHARRTPGKATDDARHSGIRDQPSARRRTPCEAVCRQTCRLRCPKPAGVRTLWTLPSGDHGAAGPRDNRVAPRAQPSRPTEPPPRPDRRMPIRAEVAEARARP